MIMHGSCDQIVKGDFGKKTRGVKRANGFKISKHFTSDVGLFLESGFSWHNAKKLVMMVKSGGGLKFKIKFWDSI